MVQRYLFLFVSETVLAVAQAEGFFLGGGTRLGLKMLAAVTTLYLFFETGSHAVPGYALAPGVGGGFVFFLFSPGLRTPC